MSRSARAPAVASAAVVALVLASPARGQELPADAAAPLPDLVLLAVAACPESSLRVEVLVERLRVELLGDGISELRLLDPAEASAPAPPGVAEIRVAASPCGSDASVFEVTIEDRVTRKRVQRTLELATSAGDSRARALALAIAELLRASWAELAVGDPPAEAPPALVEAMRVRWRRPRAEPARPWAPPPSPPAGRAPEPAIAAVFVVRSFPAASAAPLGGRASLELLASDSFVVRIDAEVVTGRSYDRLGTIRLGMATAGLGGALVTVLADVLLTVGPRIAAGLAWVRGEAAEPGIAASSATDAVITAGGTLDLDVRLGRGWSLRFGAEVAGVILGLDATVGTMPVTGISGPALGVWTGIARSL